MWGHNPSAAEAETGERTVNRPLRLNPKPGSAKSDKSRGLGRAPCSKSQFLSKAGMRSGHRI